MAMRHTATHEPPEYPGHEYEEIAKPPAYENVPPHVDPTPTSVSPSSSPNKRVYWYALGLSLGVAVVVGIIAGVTYYALQSESGTNDPDDDGWGAWGDWGACDVTCGGGWMTRSRECLVDTCTGSTHQVAECATTSCPQPEFPVWSSWGPWSACSVTCGPGSQSRQRSCGDGECTGNSTQHRSCPGWSCPDCSEPCPGGGAWNASCTWCECPGADLSGRVISDVSTPLSGVSVSPGHAPFVTVYVTDAQGSFTVNDVCIGQTLLFRKPGYVDQMYDVTSVPGPVQVSLQEIVPLSMTTQPEAKSRLVGESVRLCCTATGSPPPQYYEWFKDGQILLTDVTSGSSSLSMDDLQEEQEGDYRCRANNDFSSVYSQPVALHVKQNSSDFCSPHPTSHRIQLPLGCETQGGALSYDVGKCPNLLCRLEAENESTSCQDDQLFECGPTSSAKIDLVCSEGSYVIFKTLSCGCIRSISSSLQVSGNLQAADTLQAVSYGRVQLPDGQSVSADVNGHFVINVEPPQRRVPLTVTDLYDELVETRHVVYVNNLKGVTSVNIKLLRKAEPVVFDASDEAFLTMGGGNGNSMFGGVRIPAGSVYRDDGSKFTGNVVARLNVIDPRNLSDIENAPSDFIFMDEEGEPQLLNTFGMFYMQVEDSSGSPLRVQGDIEVSLDSTLAGDNIPNLYSLDVDGRWVEIARMHQEKTKRAATEHFSSVLVGTIDLPVSDRWLNLDYRYPSSTCVSKVRLYKNNAYMEQIANARPYVIITANPISQRYSELLFSKDGFCIAHPCDVLYDSNTKGYILVEHGTGKRAFPVSDGNIDDHGIKDEQLKDRISYKNVGDAISADMSYFKQQSQNGPFYRYSMAYSADCDSADENDNHFRFHQEEVSAVCGETEDFTVRELRLGEIGPENYYVWYTKNLVPSAFADTVVYIKVTTTGNLPIMLQAVSKVGNNTQDGVRVGESYGHRFGCKDEEEAVCLELKPSGEVSNGSATSIIRDDTLIRVQTVLGESRDLCTGYSINPSLNDYVGHPSPDDVDESFFELSMSEAFQQQLGFRQGVYWYRGDSTDDLKTVKDHVYNACRRGVSPNSPVTEGPTNADNAALNFICV